MSILKYPKKAGKKCNFVTEGFYMVQSLDIKGKFGYSGFVTERQNRSVKM